MRKILRQRSFKLHILTGCRMYKTNDHGMQTLSLQMKFGWTYAIYFITEQGVPDGSHVYTDLVRSASFKSAFNIRITLKLLQHDNVSQHFYHSYN